MSSSSRPKAPGSADPPPRGVWGAFKRWLGLTRETRAYISAPGLDVVITGEPHRVRALLGVVTTALEEAENATPPPRGRPVVRPSELDERDSPYALPEAAGVQAAREAREARSAAEETWQLPGRGADRREPRLTPAATEPGEARPASARPIEARPASPRPIEAPSASPRPIEAPSATQLSPAAPPATQTLAGVPPATRAPRAGSAGTRAPPAGSTEREIPPRRRPPLRAPSLSMASLPDEGELEAERTAVEFDRRPMLAREDSES